MLPPYAPAGIAGCDPSAEEIVIDRFGRVVAQPFLGVRGAVPFSSLRTRSCPAVFHNAGVAVWQQRRRAEKNSPKRSQAASG